MTVAIGTKVAKLKEANDKAVLSDTIIITDLATKFVNETEDRREALRPIIQERATHLLRMLSRDEGFDLVERLV